jgi:hypothetical protein
MSLYMEEFRHQIAIIPDIFSDKTYEIHLFIWLDMNSDSNNSAN